MNENLLKELFEILEGSTDSFWKNIAKVEKSFSAQILEWAIKNLDFNNGKISNSLANKQKLMRLKDQMIKAFNFDENEAAISKYLKDIDSVENINYKLLEDQTKKTTIEKVGFNLEKQLLFDDTINLLTNKTSFTELILPDLRQTLFRGIVGNLTFKQLEKEVERSLLSTDKDSNLLRYTKQISRDAISQYDGAIQAKALEIYKFNAFRYTGSLIETSRKTCIGLVKGEGEYKDLIIPNYRSVAYFTKDIQKIIDRSKDNVGWNPETNVSNFAILRGGFSCRHGVRFFMYVE